MCCGRNKLPKGLLLHLKSTKKMVKKIWEETKNEDGSVTVTIKKEDIKIVKE